MSDESLLSRIAVSPNVMADKPVIKGTRLTVEHILNLMAYETTKAEILTEYPNLTLDDLHACLLFATRALVIPDAVL